MQDVKPYKVLKPIGLGGQRREIGEVIFLTDDLAAAFGDEYVSPDSESATAEAKVEEKAAVKPKRTRKAKK